MTQVLLCTLDPDLMLTLPLELKPTLATIAWPAKIISFASQTVYKVL